MKQTRAPLLGGWLWTSAETYLQHRVLQCRHQKTQSYQRRCPVAAFRYAPTDSRRALMAYAGWTPLKPHIQSPKAVECALILWCQILDTAELIQVEKFRFEFHNFLGVLSHRIQISRHQKLVSLFPKLLLYATQMGIRTNLIEKQEKMKRKEIWTLLAASKRVFRFEFARAKSANCHTPCGITTAVVSVIDYL